MLQIPALLGEDRVPEAAGAPELLKGFFLPVAQPRLGTL